MSRPDLLTALSLAGLVACLLGFALLAVVTHHRAAAPLLALGIFAALGLICYLLPTKQDAA